MERAKPNPEHLNAIINDLSGRIGRMTVENASLKQGILERNQQIDFLEKENNSLKEKLENNPNTESEEKEAEKGE